MRDYPTITYMRCQKCGREMRSKNFPPYNNPNCPECDVLGNLGINTIKEYNDWLRKQQPTRNDAGEE